MQLTQKSLLILLSFLLAISLAGNLYSFSQDDGKSNEAQSQVAKYESKLVENEREIASLPEELEAKEVTAPVDPEEVAPAAPEPEPETSKLINTAQRFIEYAFETEPETHVTRKKLALNYMTESLYETLYSSDGMDEEQQKIAVNVKEVTVFPDSQNEKEAIVFYVYEEEILSSGYKEQKEMYVKLSFTIEGNQLKVAEIKPLENEYGGI
ncbi:hypothetical protein [Planococcus sp. ISL-109]|uniref:hypothetical protein n=1 Tax=Planococcus sp. ISL-109 TaxID=2819166 RepID=UPI001BEA0D29|nr:hypothetical protein [Planococcus sp. ISL-109]MBT2583127.1 hypothetical protein [Planococcus sp. ISL-109]